MNKFIFFWGLLLTLIIGSFVGLFLSNKTRRFAIVGFIVVLILIIAILIRRWISPFPPL